MKFKHVRINTQFFINKFHFLGYSPPYILTPTTLTWHIIRVGPIGALLRLWELGMGES